MSAPTASQAAPSAVPSRGSELGSPSASGDALSNTMQAARTVDALAQFQVRKPAVISNLPLAHPLFQLVKAICAGDELLVQSLTCEPLFDPACVLSALDDTGVTLMHIAAGYGTPTILHHLFRAAEGVTAADFENKKLALRKQVVSARSMPGAVHESSLAHGLDCLDRLQRFACEETYLRLLAVKDGHGRTPVHYAAAVRGLLLSDGILGWQQHRFSRPYSTEFPDVPLFPPSATFHCASGEVGASAGTSSGEIRDSPRSLRDGWLDVAALLRARRQPHVVDVPDAYGITPLMLATAASDTRNMRALLNMGANEFVRSVSGLTALDLASNKVVRSVLIPLDATVAAVCREVGGAVQAGDNTAADSMHPIKSGELVEGAHGEEHAPPSQGTIGVSEALQYLLNSGEDVNSRTGLHLRSPLHIAASAGALEVVRMLLANGARVDIVDVNGCSPLHLAAEQGSASHQAVVQCLVDAHADVNATSSARKTALHYAVTGSSKEVIDGGAGMIALLASLGANLNAVDTELNSALHLAAKRGNVQAMDALLLLGAYVYAANIRGQSALHLAAFHHHLPAVRLLCRWDAEVGRLKYAADSSGRTAHDIAADASTRAALHTLFEACASGRLDLVQSVAREAALCADAPAAAYPWLPVRTFEVTRVLRRSCLHILVTGAAKALFGTSKAAAGAHRARSATSGTSSPAKPAAALRALLPAGIGLRFVSSRAAAFTTAASTTSELASSLNSATLAASSGRGSACGGQPLYVDMQAYTAPPDVETESMGGSRKQRAVGVHGSELSASATEKEFGRVLEWLLRMGCELDSQDVDGVTPLMLAVRYGVLYLVRKLLARGAKPQIVDGSGNNCLHYAEALGHAAAAAIVNEFCEGEAELLNKPNAQGRLPRDVRGCGLDSLFSTSTERALKVQPPPVRSSVLLA